MFMCCYYIKKKIKNNNILVYIFGIWFFIWKIIFYFYGMMKYNVVCVVKSKWYDDSNIINGEDKN